MTYISNTTRNTGTSGLIPKYGGSFISAPGSKINTPKAPVVFGMPSNGTPFNSKINMGTANSTTPSAQPPAPITRATTSYKPTETANPQTPTNTSGLVATAPTGNSGSSATVTPPPVVTNPPAVVATPTKVAEPTETKKVKGIIPPPNPLKETTDELRRKAEIKREQDRINRQLEEQSRKGEEIGRRAGEISDMYGNKIAEVGRLGAGAVAGAKSTGTEVVGRGNAQLASESASNRIASLSAAQTAALQGTQQQLTGAEQGITGLTNVMQAMNTQQQTGVNALGIAGNLAMPSPTQYGQTVFDPLTGGFTGAGGQMDPAVQAQSLAQQVMSGAMTYDQAASSLGYAGNVGTNFLNNAITQAGGNPLNLQAQGAGQQANVATQTTAGTDIARQGLQQATTDYISMTTAAEFAHTQAGAVSNILEQTGLNNISSTDYNKALNTLKGRFSDVNYQSLNTALIEAQQAYSTLLASTGGTPSGRESQALSVLDINSSAAAINASIQELENAVSRRLSAQYGALQQYNQNLGTGATTGGGAGGGFAETW